MIAANQAQVASYKSGKEGVLGYLVGQVMKETQGKANPKVVNELLREKPECRFRTPAENLRCSSSPRSPHPRRSGAP